MSSKEVLRKKFKKKRSELSRKDVLFRSELINSKISDEEEFKKAKKIGCFYPIKNEPIINLPTDKLIYFPKISNEKLTYHLSTKKTLNNSYGIKEPDDDNPVELNHIDLILVPLLVFNENLYRIGYGKGFFDKTFSNKNVGNKNIKLWGVCYDFQKSFLDFEEKFDVRLDKIITEEKIYV